MSNASKAMVFVPFTDRRSGYICGSANDMRSGDYYPSYSCEVQFQDYPRSIRYGCLIEKLNTHNHSYYIHLSDPECAGNKIIGTTVQYRNDIVLEARKCIYIGDDRFGPRALILLQAVHVLLHRYLIDPPGRPQYSDSNHWYHVCEDRDVATIEARTCCIYKNFIISTSYCAKQEVRPRSELWK